MILEAGKTIVKYISLPVTLPIALITGHDFFDWKNTAITSFMFPKNTINIIPLKKPSSKNSTADTIVSTSHKVIDAVDTAKQMIKSPIKGAVQAGYKFTPFTAQTPIISTIGDKIANTTKVILGPENNANFYNAIYKVGEFANNALDYVSLEAFEKAQTKLKEAYTNMNKADLYQRTLERKIENGPMGPGLFDK